MSGNPDTSLSRDHAIAFEHRHRPDLDGIRGILACCVVLLHFGINTLVVRVSKGVIPRVNFELSVDIFFLLSGFVLTAAEARPRRRNLQKFALKRFLRLAPIFYLTTAVALIAPPKGYFYSLAPFELILAVPFFGIDPANFPGWSITWELYLPIIGYALAPLIPQTRPVANWVFLSLLLLALGLADVAVAQGAHLYLARSMLGLIAGHLLYRCLPSHLPVLRSWQTVALLIFIVMLMILSGRYPVLAAVIPPIAALMIASGAVNDSRLLSSRPAQWLGAISFTLYMVHIPVLLMALLIFGASFEGNPPAKLVAFGMALALATLLTRFVEIPVMNWSRRLVARLHGQAGQASNLP